MTGLFTDSEEETEESDVEETVTVLDEKDIDSAKEFLPGLYVPTYIPEGYEFEKLEIQKYYSGDFHGKYLYKSNNDTITILLYYSSDLEVSYQLPDEGNLIELSDRTILVSEDDVDKESIVFVCTETCSMDIMSDEETQVLIKIAKNMQKK